MAKKKTTVYLDSDVLTAAKAAALTSNRSESAVIEDALRSYLRSGHGDAVREELQELLERVGSTSDLDEDAALAQAVAEVRAVRLERRAGETHRPLLPCADDARLDGWQQNSVG